jgi:hypothetical protein
MENAVPPLPPQANPVAPSSPNQSIITKIKNNKTAFVFASIGLFILLGIGTYILVAQSQKTPVTPSPQENTIPVTETVSNTPTPTSSPTSSITPTSSPTANWKSYSNAQYGYSIKYPPDWTARNLGSLEPKIPSYIVFNPTTASQSARFITISVSTRSYSEQLTLGSAGSGIIVATIVGTKQSFQDSDNNTATAITLPRTNNLLVLRAKTPSLAIFNLMLSTLQITQ